MTLRKGQHATPQVIKRHDLHKASRLLGVFQNPMGDFSEHLRVMKRKTDTSFAGYIKSPRLKTHDIRVFHNTMYAPSMRYSLPAVAVDEEESGAVQAQIIPSIVQRLGFNSNLPTAIRFGPIEMGGLGLVDLRTEGGIEMLKYFRHTIYSGTEVGDMLLMHVQTSQLESDQPISLLTDPTIYIPYLTAPWVMSLRKFMSNLMIEIALTQTLTLSLKSATDEFIMPQAQLKGYSIQQQKDLNLARIFLQVTSLADLMDEQDGRLISQWGKKVEDLLISSHPSLGLVRNQ